MALLIGLGALIGAAATVLATRPAADPEPQLRVDPKLDRALAAIRSRGFVVVDASTYGPRDRLRVLVGVPRERGATAPPQQVFFFVGDRFARTDERASGSARVLWTGGDEVAVSYQLWGLNDPNCCPTLGAVTVVYALRGGRVVALDPVPASSRSFRDS
jgi:hypothetical protein